MRLYVHKTILHLISKQCQKVSFGFVARVTISDLTNFAVASGSLRHSPGLQKSPHRSVNQLGMPFFRCGDL